MKAVVLLIGLSFAAAFALLLAARVHLNAGLVWLGGCLFGLALRELAGRLE